MNGELEKQLSLIREEAVITLQKWIRQPSVPTEPASGAPFGKDIRAMLDMAEKDMKSLGFETFVDDGYAMHADCGDGKAEEALGILGHLDVVPGIFTTERSGAAAPATTRARWSRRRMRWRR